MHKCAIVYHYLASYRKPIFTELMKSVSVEFTLYSGLVSEIDIKKIDVEIANLSLGEGGLRWMFLKNNWLFRKKFLWQSGLLKLAFSSSFDSFIFLGSPYHLSTWIASIIAQLRGKDVYYWMHGVYKDEPSKVNWIKLNVFYKLATGFFLYGNRSLSILKRHKVKPDDKIHVIYNSLDYEESVKMRKVVNEKSVKEYRIKYFNDDSFPVAVFIGRLNNIKKIDMLINAQHILKQKQKGIFFNVLLIGDGEEKDKLIKLSETLGLSENVKFLGAVYDETIISQAVIYADICVVPGAVGLTAIHALSYGTPIISHNNLDLQMPEVESIVQGVTGNLYEYNNLENLAEVIEQWLLIHPLKTPKLMKDCFAVIDEFYNPYYQRKIIESVLENKKKS